jgi:hypothetical protein
MLTHSRDSTSKRNWCLETWYIERVVLIWINFLCCTVYFWLSMAPNPQFGKCWYIEKTCLLRIFKIKAVPVTGWNECSENTMCPYHCANCCYNDFILPVRAYCKLSAKLLRVVVPHVVQERLTREINYIVSNNRKSMQVDTEGRGVKQSGPTKLYYYNTYRLGGTTQTKSQKAGPWLQIWTRNLAKQNSSDNHCTAVPVQWPE